MRILKKVHGKIKLAAKHAQDLINFNEERTLARDNFIKFIT